MKTIELSWFLKNKNFGRREGIKMKFLKKKLTETFNMLIIVVIRTLPRGRTRTRSSQTLRGGGSPGWTSPASGSRN